jgi:hypothetical protein
LPEANRTRTANPTFLYDTVQLGHRNETRCCQFLTNVQQSLGLFQELPSVLHFLPGKTTIKITLKDQQNCQKDKNLWQTIQQKAEVVYLLVP